MPASLSARLGISPKSLRVVSTYYFSYIALGLISPALGTALPFLIERTGVSLDIASGLFSARALGFILGSFVTGRAMERLPSHGVIQAALLALALALVTIAVAPEFILLVVILFLTGFYASWLDVGSNILIVWQLKKKVAPFLTGLHFIWGFGALAAPLIIVQLQFRTGSLLAPLAVIAAFVSACGLLYVRLPSPKPIKTTREQGTHLPKIPLAIFMAMLFLAGTMELAIGGFIFTYLLRTGLSTEQVAGGITSTFYAAITCTRLVAAFMLLRFSSQTVMKFSLGLVLTTAITVLLLPPSPTVIWIAVLLCGIGEATLFPLALALAPQYLPAAGRATSLMFVGGSIGALTMPLLIGNLFESAAVGPQVIWLYTFTGAAMYACCLVVLHFWSQLKETAVPVPQIAGSN